MNYLYILKENDPLLVTKFYMPYCYNIQNTDERQLFSLFLD